MGNIFWLGALLLFDTCIANPQNPITLGQSGSHSTNILSLSINMKKCIHTVSDHFLSFTLEPSNIFSALQKNSGSIAIGMAKGLSPAYIRISGPECNYFRFQGGLDTSQSSPVYPVKQGRNNLTITGWHWSQLNEFIAKTGLDLIVGLNVMNRQHGSWDLSNTLDLISYSDKHGYNMEFQIGNDLQTIGSRIDGSSLGKDVSRLRKVLEAFPRYMNSAIISPDIKSCDTQEEARYLKNFIVESGSSLTATPYQVPFSSEKNVENPTEMFNYIQNQLESRVWQKDSINKYLGKIANKKPLWIIESGNKDRRGDFSDGLTWAQRLCAGARVGINVIMRKPSLLSLSEPTPDYWVSVLYKALVGTEVLDTKISSANKTRLETVTHCTKMSPYDPNEGILAPEYRYNRGSVIVFGVNMGSETVKISIKTGQKQSLPLHQYFLTANNRPRRKRAVKPISTLLNGQKLILSPNGDLPIISPKIRGSHQMISIPSQCVFFIVLPESKSKACMPVQIDEFKESYKNDGRNIVNQEEFDETDYETSVLDQEDDSVSNEKNIYVAFRPKYTNTNYDTLTQQNGIQERSKVKNNEMGQQNNDGSHYNDNLQQSEPVVKYVTFSNNNWLSKFPKSLKNYEYSIEQSTSPPTESTTIELQTERSITPSQSRREKYHILAQAVAGKRYVEKTLQSDLHSKLDSAMATLRPSQKLKLIKRSVEISTPSSKEIEDIFEQFTNREKQPLNSLSKNDQLSSDEYLKSNDDNMKVSERPKKEINLEISETQQPTFITQTTQQTMIPSTPPMLTEVNHHTSVESHVQKIKTKKEQALARISERTSHKRNERKSKDKFREEVKNSTAQELITEDSMVTTSTEGSVTQKELTHIEQVTSLADKIRFNRQTNNTGSNLKTTIPRISIKLRKTIKNIEAENVETTSSPVIETTHSEPCSTTTEVSVSKTTKLRNHIHRPKILRLAKPRVIDEEESKREKPKIRESRETTQHPVPKLKIKPILHPLGRVKTSPNVDIDQIVTNEKVTERLIENIKDGNTKLQSEHIIVSPIDKNEEIKSETRSSLTTAAKIKALEAKAKSRLSEVERRIHEKIHKVNKRSSSNNIIKDDEMDTNNILNYRRFGSNELDVDVGPVLKRETYRYPRAVADFTVKLNEVNTYVDKNRRTKKPKNNEIIENSDSESPKDWNNTNDIRLSAEDTEFDNVNIKSKRKSIFEELDDEDYSKTTTMVMSKLLSHMKTFWKYIKKTLQF